MSYEIIYDKQFIELKKDNELVYIPMIYAGSNNCYEISFRGRERRARSWYNLSYYTENNIYATKDFLIKKVEEERARIIENNEKELARGDSWATPYKDSAYGYFASVAINGHTSNTSFGQFKGIFTTGIKKALTVEKLLEFGVSTKLYIYHYDQKDIEEIKKITDLSIEVYPKTSEELLSLIEKYKSELKGTKYEHKVYVTIRASENQMKSIRRELFPQSRKEKTLKTFDSFFVVRYKESNRFVARLTKNGLMFSYNENGGKQFVSKKQAEKWKEKVERKMGKLFVVEEIKKTIQKYV